MAMWHEVKSIMISTYDARQRAWLVVCLPHIAVVVVVFGFVKKNVPLSIFFLLSACFVFAYPTMVPVPASSPPRQCCFVGHWRVDIGRHIYMCYALICALTPPMTPRSGPKGWGARTNQVGSNKQQVPDDYLRTLSGGHIIINNHYYTYYNNSCGYDILSHPAVGSVLWTVARI